jgi:hypothetical protein
MGGVHQRLLHGRDDLFAVHAAKCTFPVLPGVCRHSVSHSFGVLILSQNQVAKADAAFFDRADSTRISSIRFWVSLFIRPFHALPPSAAAAASPRCLAAGNAVQIAHWLKFPNEPPRYKKNAGTDSDGYQHGEHGTNHRGLP